MRCYLDDLCYDKIEIGDNVTISYGCYFACHGRKQGHNRIIIKDGAYIGMRASIIAPKGDVVIGEKAIIGTMTLVNECSGRDDGSGRAVQDIGEEGTESGCTREEYRKWKRLKRNWSRL